MHSRCLIVDLCLSKLKPLCGLSLTLAPHGSSKGINSLSPIDSQVHYSSFNYLLEHSWSL